MANPSGTHRRQQPAARQANGNRNSAPLQENSAAVNPAVLHSAGFSTVWSTEEQAILEEGMNKYATETNIVRYAKIAVLLRKKSVRDVAMRCRWMTKKENTKRRNKERNLLKKDKERKEKALGATVKFPHLAVSSFPPYGQALIIGGNDDSMSYYATGGVTRQLLEQNVKAFEQISANLAAHQIHGNLSLLCRARDNILKILSNLSNMPETTKQMPPILEKLDEKLANSILPRSIIPMRS